MLKYVDCNMIMPHTRIFNLIKTMDITNKFDVKSGLFSREVYYDNKQTNPKISNRINDPLFLTLAC